MGHNDQRGSVLCPAAHTPSRLHRPPPSSRAVAIGPLTHSWGAICGRQGYPEPRAAEPGNQQAAEEVAQQRHGERGPQPQEASLELGRRWDPQALGVGRRPEPFLVLTPSRSRVISGSLEHDFFWPSGLFYFNVSLFLRSVGKNVLAPMPHLLPSLNPRISNLTGRFSRDT